MSILLLACAPPLKIFNIGFGIEKFIFLPSIFSKTTFKYSYSSKLDELAAALEAAIDTERIEFAPRFDLFFVLSKSIINLSISI